MNFLRKFLWHRAKWKQTATININLFAETAKMARLLDSLYKGNIFGRNDLLEFIDANEWFGITPTIQDGTPFLSSHDFEVFKKPLNLWLSAYKKPGREKIRLMLECYGDIYHVTCRLYREFVTRQKIEDTPAAWKLLDYLLAEINREITDYSGHEIEGLAKGVSAGTPINTARLFGDFLRTAEYNGAPLTEWAYAFSSRDAPDHTNDAYPLHDFAIMAYHIFNEEMWKEHRLIEIAVQTKVYADLWLFTALHFICALRTTDLKRLPAPTLPCNSETLLQRISDGTFSKQEASTLVGVLIIRLNMKPMRPSKTSARENIPLIKLFIPESLRAPLGMIMAISLAHHPEIRPGEGFVFSVQENLLKIRHFFGMRFAAALGNRRFASRRCNKSYLQGIERVADSNGATGKPKGYMLAALARSHKGGIGSLPKTTDIYLKDAIFSGYTPEFIIREMFERGVFVDSYFENSGDPGKLKCSFLEVYATSIGIEVKAYDFRRNEAVRKRMAELRGSAQTDGGGSLAYKSLDVDAFRNRNYTREMLRNSLLELEETWMRIYKKAIDSAERNKILLSDVLSKKQTIDALATEKETLETKVKALDKTSNALLIENRYLKKMLRQYLYPAIANEILKNENVLEQVDTEVAKTAMDRITDPAMPASFGGGQ